LKKDLEEWIKGINFAAAFDKGATLIKRRKKYFKKYLVEWKKGCTFAPAKKMGVTNEAKKNFLKKIWRSEKKVIPLHPQKERQVH